MAPPFLRPMGLKANMFTPRLLLLAHRTTTAAAAVRGHALPMLRAPPRRLQSTSSASSSRGPGGGWGSTAVIFAGGVGAGWLLMSRRRGRKSTSTDGSQTDMASGGAPQLDVGPDSSSVSLPAAPGPAEVTARLNANAFSVASPGVPGVTRYDGAQVASNAACEDRLVHGRMPAPYPAATTGAAAAASDDGKKQRQQRWWAAWGVFDGHVGPRTAEALETYLVPYVHRFLATLAGPTMAAADGDVEAKIREAFLALDDTFVSQAVAAVDDDSLSFSQKVAALGPGSNGSCALLGLWEPAAAGGGGTLRVACAGDSRAVLGRLADRATPDATGDGTDAGSAKQRWETIALSEDQTGSSASETARINALHPDEPEVVKGGRVLGLMCSRAFGDGHWKWAHAFVADVKRRFNGDAMRALPAEKYKTPPYITAEPVVTTTRIEPGRKSFLVVATDGLWDTMSSERVVDLVGRWIEWKERGGEPDVAGVDPTVFKDVDMSTPSKEWADKSWVVKDDNAAVHLVRNALGGANDEMLAAMMFFRYPFSRDARDDITVQVIFFD